MRIVAGKYRSRRLQGPRAGKFRPTSDRVREALFNLLGPLGPGIAFADLYAGSGAIGLEAASRGAGRIVLVESSGSSCWTIRQNLRLLEPTEEIEVIQSRVESFLAAQTERFNVVFADPPYELDVPKVAAALGAHPLLAPGGLLVLEHSRRQQAPARAGRLVQEQLRRYGDTQLALYREPLPSAGEDAPEVDEG
ncbi:MAG: 16S rRNA (guanine(966)-N(2))-methyltransferase RsmD [Candidatus Riflebacteria bacterium]|nr:16S rRNA (guanine(966)-N(2))-methyltransferase RsmD [Candidatus Riflebacteria bacterium]